MPGYYEAEAYQVYSAILQSNFARLEADAKTLIILEETAGHEMCLKPDSESAAILGPAIADYVRKKKRTWALQRWLEIDKPYALITGWDLKAAFGQGTLDARWKAFVERYPGSVGYITLSAVGFNKSKTVAVVYSGYMSCPFCGGGSFSVLQKKDGKWQPLKWSGTPCPRVYF